MYCVTVSQIRWVGDNENVIWKRLKNIFFDKSEFRRRKLSIFFSPSFFSPTYTFNLYIQKRWLMIRKASNNFSMRSAFYAWVVLWRELSMRYTRGILNSSNRIGEMRSHAWQRQKQIVTDAKAIAYVGRIFRTNFPSHRGTNCSRRIGRDVLLKGETPRRRPHRFFFPSRK